MSGKPDSRCRVVLGIWHALPYVHARAGVQLQGCWCACDMLYGIEEINNIENEACSVVSAIKQRQLIL
jgi:hypothetical protein